MIDTEIEKQMSLRQEVLQILFKKFGNGDYSNKSIYECAHDWVSQGHPTTEGLIQYYSTNYND